MSTNSPIRWPVEDIWQEVVAEVPDFTIEVVPSIDSTNTELMRRARAGRCEPILLVTEEQTAGRGRLGRPWQSEQRQQATPATPSGPASLTMSLGLPLRPQSWSGLSLAVGVTVAQSIQPELPAAASGMPRVGLKWPNDLWLEGDRKFGGILVETASYLAPQGGAADPADLASLRYVIVGIGLNVLARPGDGMTTPPASITEIDGRWTAPLALRAIVPNLVRTLRQFERNGFVPFRRRFEERDLLLGREIHLSSGERGVARGVSEDGTLLLDTDAGLQAVTSADVSVRPAGQPLPSQNTP